MFSSVPNWRTAQEPSDENLARLARALGRLYAKLRMGDEALPAAITLRMLKGAVRHNWETKHGDLDTHYTVAGIDSYKEVETRAWTVNLGGREVLTVPLTTLITMKEAAGREKDQLALNELYELETMGAERGEVIEQPVREASSDVSDDT